MKFKSWIEAARLRTLPLSVSGIIVGCGMAFADNSFNGLLLALLLATTILLQVLGNFANDLGDFQHGTDNDNRVGPKRTLQGGGLTVGEMKRGIVIMIVLSLAVGITMLCVSFGISFGFWVFVAIGLAAIVAAIRYTMGRNPFGYRGLGDLMVLIFFGFATVVGSYFIMTHHVTIDSILMGTAIGFMSVGVLNVNNLRDCESDRESGKVTIVVKLGIVLIAATLVIEKQAVGMLWVLLPTILLMLHSLRVLRASDVKTLDPELKKLSLTTLLMSVLYVVAIIWR